VTGGFLVKTSQQQQQQQQQQQASILGFSSNKGKYSIIHLLKPF
jgi:hypothetical protein